MKDLKNKQEIFARKCDITGKGMNKGFCINDGMMYIKEQEDLIKHLRGLNCPDYEGETDEDMLEISHENEYYYYTEWFEVLDEMDEHYTADGELIK